MDESKYKHIDTSSLLDLKAELYKKHEALKQAKLDGISEESVKRKGIKLKGEDFPKKAKQNVSQFATAVKESGEDEKEFQKLKLSLERKAKLYERIMTKKVALADDDDEESEMYMVDFRRKLMNSDKEPVHNPNVNRESHNTLKVNDGPVSPVVDNFKPSSKKVFTSVNSNPAGLNTPMPPPVNLLEVNEANGDGPVHYQNVQYNEVRDHGVGYYAFSTDEEKRKEQMESLKTLRQQTEKKKMAFKNAEQKRKTALQARLAKICERRNIDKSVIDGLVPKDDVNNGESQNDQEKHINVDLNDIPLPEDIAADSEPLKPTKIRPWDEGKQGVSVQVPLTKGKKYTQKEWIEERRLERDKEFAPPPTYF